MTRFTWIPRPLALVALLGCNEGGNTDPGELTAVTIWPCPVNTFVGPVWVAYRNGDGAWTQVQPDALGKYTFGAASRASVAYAYQGPESRRETRIVNATGPELALLVDEPCTIGRGTATLTGTLRVNGDGAAIITASNRVTVAITENGQATWDLTQLPAGSTDIVATGVDDENRERAIVRRDVVPGQTPIALDFRTAEPMAPALSTVSVNGLPTGRTTTLLGQLKTSGGTYHPLFNASTSEPLTVTSLAVAQREPDDVYAVRLRSQDAIGTDIRFVHFGYSTPEAAFSKTFGPAMTQPTVTPLTSVEYPRMRAVFASLPEYPDAAKATFHESFRVMHVTTTAAYLGGTPSNWELEVPDLSGAGYLKEWGISAPPRSWEAAAIKGSVHILEGGLPRNGETATIGVRRVIQSGFAPPM